jgi:2-isopropylmalate synthase
MSRVFIYDTTLRDGAQAEGVSFSLRDKLQITAKLAELGVDFVEGGWPGSNPKDINFFKQAKKMKLGKTQLVAFGSTRRPHKKAHQDPILKSLLEAKTKYITIFGKSSAMQVRDVLRTSPEENLKMISESISFLKKKGKKVFFDAEHFFDGFKDNAEYALEVVKTAEAAGAEAVVLCDTNGGTLTSEIYEIVAILKEETNVSLGIHTHNDNGMAVANSVTAVEAGCNHIQGTINGIGERCGNADLCAIIPSIELKLKDKCLPKGKLKELTEVSRYISEVCNLKQRSDQPYVGTSAFAHKAGVHVNAVMKKPQTYEHVEPEKVGNKRKFIISELAGKSSIINKAKELNIDLTKDTPKTREILSMLQNMEHEGYHFEAGEASFELLMKRLMGKYKPFFELGGFRVINEKRINPKTNKPELFTEATIEIVVKGIMEHTAAEGDGPVNAIDNALRKALESFYPSLKHMHLTDFKVRVLDQKAGTEAKVRVLVQSQDEENIWSTVGVSADIIEASWQALVDSFEYKLLKDKNKK